MRKRILVIALVLSASLLILLSLKYRVKNPATQKNGFARHFLSIKIKEVNRTKLSDQFLKICGTTTDNIILCDGEPGRITITDKSLKLLKTVQLPIHKINNIAPVFYTTVDYPKVLILAGQSKLFIEGNLETRNYKVTQLHTNSFSNGIVVTPTSFIMRVMDPANISSHFQKANLITRTCIRDSNISEKGQYTAFTYDGKLNYDPVAKKVFYVADYCNRIKCMDTSLQLLYNAHTIDTVNSPDIQVSEHKGIISFTKPPFTTNKNISTANGILFILSALKADNESIIEFSDNDVIDLYSEMNGDYLGSIYLPSAHKPVISFQFFNDDTLVVLYPDALVKYLTTQKLSSYCNKEGIQADSL